MNTSGMKTKDGYKIQTHGATQARQMTLERQNEAKYIHPNNFQRAKVEFEARTVWQRNHRISIDNCAARSGFQVAKAFAHYADLDYT